MLVLDNAKVHIIYSSPCIFAGKPTAMRCVNSATAHDGTKNRLAEQESWCHVAGDEGEVGTVARLFSYDATKSHRFNGTNPFLCESRRFPSVIAITSSRNHLEKFKKSPRKVQEVAMISSRSCRDFRNKLSFPLSPKIHPRRRR